MSENPTLAAPATAAPPLSNSLVWLMALSCGLVVANIYYNQPLLATIGHEFGVPDNRASLIATATQAGYTLGMLLLVPLGDKLERKGFMLWLIAGAALCLAGAALAPAFAVLAVAMTVASFLQFRRFADLMNIVLQVLLVIGGIVVHPIVFIVAVLFVLTWWYTYYLRGHLRQRMERGLLPAQHVWVDENKDSRM